jgi:CBS domain-containing protein
METVADLMTPHPLCLRPDERLDIALALMVACRFRHLPVEESGEPRGRLIGIVSLRDLYSVDLSHLSTSPRERGRHLRSIEARAVMRAPVVTTRPETSLWDAAKVLLDQRISSLPVVREGRLVGIVTRTDFLRPAIARLDEESAREGRPLPVSRLMSPSPLVTTGPRDRLDVARALMTAERIHHLPVLADDGETLIGILSEHDALAASEPRPGSAASQPPFEELLARHAIEVQEAMSMRVVTVLPEDAAAGAARLLDRRRFGALPVVTSGGRLIGMLSVSDFFYYLLSLAPAHPGAHP